MSTLRALDAYPLDELKRIYHVLHGALPQEPELMDSELLGDLQQWLQQCARADGVDVSLHADWAAWLGGLR
jgi:hypothetical protein